MDWLKRPVNLLVLAGAGVGAGALVYTAYNKHKQQQQQQQQHDDDPYNFSHLLDRTDISGDVSIEDTTTTSEGATPCDVTSATDATLGDLVVDDNNDSALSTGFEDTEVDDSKRCRKILLLGLERSGKSCLLAKLSRNMDVDNEYTATKGYNVVCISHENYNVSMWEIGGSAMYRSYWRNFCATTDLVLFVVDVNQPETLQQSKEFIFEVVTELEDGVDFHIVANVTADTDEDVVEGLAGQLGVNQLNIPVHSINLECTDEDEGGSDVQTLLTSCLDKLS